MPGLRPPRIQQKRDPAEFYACDIAKFKAPDISQMPYGQRRELYEAVIEEIRLFNRHLHVVPVMPEGGDPVEFYRAMPHESLAGSTDPDESREMMFRLKSSTGWQR